MSQRKALEPTNLIVRSDHVLCTICGDAEPVHAGHGTPLPSLLIAYQWAAQRHPNHPHESLQKAQLLR